MPSLRHQALVQLFRNRPELAAVLLADQGVTPLPNFTAARSETSDLGQLLPTEYWADSVILLLGEDGSPVHAIALEVQLRIDARKQFSWPLYAVALRARHLCPATLVVVTPHRAVARWARAPIDLGQPASHFHPWVIGPDEVPLVTDPAHACEEPELAVLSAQVHGHGRHGAEVATAAVEGVRTAQLDRERAMLYLDLIWHALSRAARERLEASMNRETHQYLSDWAREHLKEGWEKGWKEGRAEGRAEAVLRVLSARGLDVSAAQRARVLECTDLGILDGWLELAVHVDSTAALLESSPSANE
jgi:hypothetical protein